MTALHELPAGTLSVPDALARAGPRAVLSHELAALLHGLELLDPPVPRLTVPEQRSRLRVPGWQVRRLDLGRGEVEETAAGLRATTLLRTLVDLSLVLGLAEAVAAADAALRLQLLEPGDLRSTLGTRRGRGAGRCRAVALLVDPLAGSVIESVARVLLALAGLPAPATQHVISHGGAFVARVDVAWPAARLVVEIDGFAFHSDRAAYRADRERLNALEVLGWRVLRFTYEDVRSRPEHVVATVRRCLAG